MMAMLMLTAMLMETQKLKPMMTLLLKLMVMLRVKSRLRSALAWLQLLLLVAYPMIKKLI